MDSQTHPPQPTAPPPAPTWGRAVGTLWTLLARPTATLRQIADERPLLPASVVVMLSTWCWAWGARWAKEAELPSPAEAVRFFVPALRGLMEMVHHGNGFLLLLLLVPMSLLGWFLRVAVVHLLAEMSGGKGKALSLMAAMGFAYAPLALLFPAALLCYELGGRAEGAGVVILWSLLALSIHLWSLTLIVLAVREAHQLSTGVAAGIVAVLLAALGVVAVVLAFTAPSA